MLRLHLIAIATAAGLMWPSAAEAKGDRLLPSSKWEINYANDSCELSRTFGTGDQMVILQFIRYAPGTSFDLNIIGRALGPLRPYPRVGLRFGASGEFLTSEAMDGFSQWKVEGPASRPIKIPALFLKGRLDNLDESRLTSAELQKLSPDELQRVYSTDPAAEAAVTSATIRLYGRTLEIQLGSMGPPMAAMRRCTTALVKTWGLDPAKVEALVRPPCPLNSPGQWLNSSDYPRGSLLDGEQAIIRFRLMVSETGEVTSCSIQSAIAKDDFAELSCRLIKRRARFEPGRAADGTAIPSYYVSKVIWRAG